MNLPVKTIIGVSATILVVGCLLAYIFGSGQGGFLSSFKDAGPVSFVPEDGVYKDSPGMEFLAAREKPFIKAYDQKTRVNEAYPAESFVLSVTDADGNDLVGSLKAKGEQLDGAGIFRADSPGTYIVTFNVTDGYGAKAVKSIRVIVEH